MTQARYDGGPAFLEPYDGHGGGADCNWIMAGSAQPERPEVTVGDAAQRIMRDKTARDDAFNAMWLVAEKHRLEVTTAAGSRYFITGDVVNELYYAALCALAQEDKTDG